MSIGGKEQIYMTFRDRRTLIDKNIWYALFLARMTQLHMKKLRQVTII